MIKSLNLQLYLVHLIEQFVRLMTVLSRSVSILIHRVTSLLEISDLLRLRVAIGFLGEKSQCNWWQSDFFGAASASFLQPVFPRTQFLTQVEGVSAAAGRLHDERIGVGEVFHLFRLPEDFEQSFHQSLQDRDVIDGLAPIVESKESALGFLEANFGKPKKPQLGPVSVRKISHIATKKVTDLIGNHYLSAFQADEHDPVFPYLKDEQ